LDGQFDECELTLRELSRIEASLSKSLAAHHHGRIAYPTAEETAKTNGNDTDNDSDATGRQTEVNQDNAHEEPAI
jgi:hypothetical protein